MRSLSWFRYLVPKDEETEPGFKAEIDRLSLIGLRAIAAVCIGATAMMFLIGSILYHGEVKEWIFPLTDLTVMSIGVAALALSYSRRASGWGRLGGSLVGCVNNGRLQSVFDEAVRSGRQSSERLRDAVQRLKQLTSLDRADEQMVDLNEVWSDTVTFLRTELEAKADLSMDLTPLPRVKCRPQQLSAVFSNLLRNAAAAIPERGKIAITSDRRVEELVFRVQDNGRGNPAAVSSVGNKKGDSPIG